MSLELWIVFVITVFLASIVPGPSMLLALTHGMKYGARRTVASALGNVTVSLIQAAISIAGLGAVLTASENIFLFIKWCGAAYLIYVGIKIWQAPEMVAPEGNTATVSDRASLKKMFGQAAVVTAGNPKAILFFTAIFPQFIDSSAPKVSQFFTLMSTGAVIAFVCFMIYAAGGQKIIAILSRRQMCRYLNRVIGTSFIGAGIGLAWSRK